MSRIRAAAPLNDGVVAIYGVKNVAPPGHAPDERLSLKGQLRYKIRTVGYGRYYAAKEANVRVDLLLRVPRRPFISPQDVAIPTLDGKQYRIVQVQTPEDAAYPLLDLSLQRLDQDYRSGQEVEP